LKIPLTMTDTEAPPFSLWNKLVGDYDYSRLCKPRFNPWKKENQEPLPFYGPGDRLSFLFAMLAGFQHSLAVVGGTIIPGIILGNLDPSGNSGSYLVSYALITSGICTWIQIRKTPIPKTPYFVGSGMLCVIATSFAFLPTAQQSITTQMNEGKSFDEAYGSLLGVFMVGAIFQSMISFVPGRILRRVFPQWLAGLCVFLIGVNLTAVGVKSWGGGGDCAGDPMALCSQVGDSKLPFGSSEYLGLGFFVMSTIVLIELFGSPFLRSCGIAIALLLGYVLAAITTDRNGDSYTNTAAIKEAPTILFLWTRTFPIGFVSSATRYHGCVHCCHCFTNICISFILSFFSTRRHSYLLLLPLWCLRSRHTAIHRQLQRPPESSPTMRKLASATRRQCKVVSLETRSTVSFRL
jgi:xanthine/uracil permease